MQMYTEFVHLVLELKDMNSKDKSVFKFQNLPHNESVFSRTSLLTQTWL